MNKYEKRIWPFAIALAALAGYVDAIGFLRLGGFFVSFMSGNSTRLAVGIARGSAPALIAGPLIGLFVLGAIAGSLVAASAAARRKVAVLALVTALLGAAAGMAAIGHDRSAIAALALAMGAENAVFRRDGEVSIGVTYMTGALVKLAQGIADVMLGRSRWGWLPYLLLWLGLVAGATAGAAAYQAFGMAALWIATAAGAALTLVAAALGPAPPGQSR